MTLLHRPYARARELWRERGVLLKAVSFALIGVVNTLIDAGVFFLVYTLLGTVPGAPESLARLAGLLHVASVPTVRLIASNLVAWYVAVSVSYVLNSSITFAAESGRKLTRRAYATFVLSGIVGVVANTTVLVLAAQVLPVWGAKGLAILASFVANFSLSHFVVFRRRVPAPMADSTAPGQGSSRRG